MKNPKSYTIHVGIDISKLHLDIVLEDSNLDTFALQVENNPNGFEQLDQWLHQHGAEKARTILCSEHTGRYGEHLGQWSAHTGWDHAIVKTTALKKVSPEHHRKEDDFDAALLAEYARRFSDKLRLYQDPGPVARQLKQLQTERRFMVKQRASLKQKVTEADYHHACMEQIVQAYGEQIQLLDKHIEKVERQIQHLIHQTEYLTSTFSLLKSAPGVGKVIATKWITLFCGQQTLNPRKISSRFGFAPHAYNSGSSVRQTTRSSRYGDPEMRKLMTLAARSVLTHTKHYREYYRQKLQEGKPKKVAINNIINKLIRMLCAMWNKGVKYDPGHVEKLKKIHQAA